MNRLLPFFFCIAIFATAKGQSNYTDAMQQGDEAFNKQQYKTAINKYFAAEAFDPTKKAFVKAKVNLVFDRIEKLRIEAEKAKKEAETQKGIVTNSSEAFRLIILARQMADDDPTFALRIADLAMQKKRDTIIVKEAQKIYDQHAFYKTINGSYGSLCKILPDGKGILTYNNGIISLSSPNGILLKEFKTNKNINLAASQPFILSPDETMVLVAGYDSTARLWDFNGTLVKEFRNKSSNINSVSFSPDGKKIMAGCSDSTIYLWNIDGSLLNKFIVPWRMNNVNFSPDGTKILTGSTGLSPMLWDLNGTLSKWFEHNKYFCGTFSPDGTKILIGNLDSTAKLWSIDGTLLKSFRVNSGAARSVAFSPDGTRILVGATDGTTNLWRTDGTLLKLLKARNYSSDVSSVGFSADGSKAITYDSKLRFWNIEAVPLKEFNLQGSWWRRVIFSPDKTKILVKTKNNTASIFNMEGEVLKEYEVQGDFNSMDLSPDGKKILLGSSGGVARLWNSDGTLIKEFNEPSEQNISLVAFSPDGTKILTGSSGLFYSYTYKFTLWKIDGTKLVDIEDHSHSFNSAAFSPDGTKILITGENRHVISHSMKLWDVDGKLIKDFSGDTHYINCIAFSPDGTKILTGSEGGTVRLWSITGISIQDFIGHNAKITSVAFSPDGKRILTSSEDGTARLWDVNGTLIWKYEGFERRVSSSTFSSDGTKVFTVNGDDMVRVWNSIKPLREFLQDNRPNIFTSEEKKELGIK